MQCPYCLVAFNVTWQTHPIGGDNEGVWYVHYSKCPTCEKIIAKLKSNSGGKHKEFLVKPKGGSRLPLNPDVPERYSNDYNEASLILQDSPKMSATLSRRVLQHILEEEAKIKKGDLYNQIDEAIEKKLYPNYIAERLHYLRVVGNTGAHVAKNISTGEIIEVEPDEAELTLDVIVKLCDFHFVEPKKWEKDKEKTNQKLLHAGKKPLL